jgi:hypothetical protein
MSINSRNGIIVGDYNEIPDDDYVYVIKDCDGFYYGKGYPESKHLYNGVKTFERRIQARINWMGGRGMSEQFRMRFAKVIRVKKSDIP